MNRSLLLGSWVVALSWMGPSVYPDDKVATFQPLPMEGTPLIQPAIMAFQSADPAAATVDRMKVAFYNIEMFSDGIKDGKARTSALVQNQAANAARIIGTMDPDVLMISEIENAHALEILNRALQKPFPSGHVVEFASGSGRQERMNIAMLSRYSPVSADEIDFGPLTGPGRPTRGLFRAIFDLGDSHSLVLYACHLKANFGGDKPRNYSQRYHAMRLLEADVQHVTADGSRKWEVLVFGDFNTDPLIPEFRDDPTLTVLEGWSDLWSEHPQAASMFSVPTRRGDPEREFPAVLFDRVLAQPDSRVSPWVVSLPQVFAIGADTTNSKALPGEGDHVSDHYPVMVELTK